jgi:hypothetical protein
MVCQPEERDHPEADEISDELPGVLMLQEGADVRAALGPRDGEHEERHRDREDRIGEEDQPVERIHAFDT